MYKFRLSYFRTSSLFRFVKRSPTLPSKKGVTLWMFSLYSLSVLRPIANEITLFLPNRNLENFFCEFSYLFISVLSTRIELTCCPTSAVWGLWETDFSDWKSKWWTNYRKCPGILWSRFDLWNVVKIRLLLFCDASILTSVIRFCLNSRPFFFVTVRETWEIKISFA